VIDQYAAYEAVPGVKLNGALTAGENIADIGGVKLGFKAYQDWRAAQAPRPPAKVEGMTDDQMYFVAYGQSWCAKIRPETLEPQARSSPHWRPGGRVNGVVVDEPGFAAAFSCREGSPMRPPASQSCSVW